MHWETRQQNITVSRLPTKRSTPFDSMKFYTRSAKEVSCSLGSEEGSDYWISEVMKAEKVEGIGLFDIPEEVYYYIVSSEVCF